MTQHSVSKVKKWEPSGSSGSFLGSSDAVKVSHDSGSSDVAPLIPVQDDTIVQSAENAGLILGFDTRLFRNPSIETGKGIAQKLSIRTLESSKNLSQPQSRFSINAGGARSIVRTLSSKIRKIASSENVSPKLEDEKSKPSSSFRSKSSRLLFRSLRRNRGSTKSKQNKKSSFSSHRSLVKNSPSGRKVCLCPCHKFPSKIPSQKRIPSLKNQTKSKSTPQRSQTVNPMKNHPASPQSHTRRPDHPNFSPSFDPHPFSPSRRYPNRYPPYHSNHPPYHSNYPPYHSNYPHRLRPRPHDNPSPPPYPQDFPLGPSRMNYHNLGLSASKVGKKLRRRRRHSHICCGEDSDSDTSNGDNEAPSADPGCFPCCCDDNCSGDGGDNNGGECCAWMTGFFTGECIGNCFNQCESCCTCCCDDGCIDCCCDALSRVNCDDNI
nr:PREDICTED: uncharacterized protein LOC109033361 [Bemisia tabaci]